MVSCPVKWMTFFFKKVWVSCPVKWTTFFFKKGKKSNILVVKYFQTCTKSKNKATLAPDSTLNKATLAPDGILNYQLKVTVRRSNSARQPVPTAENSSPYGHPSQASARGVDTLGPRHTLFPR